MDSHFKATAKVSGRRSESQGAGELPPQPSHFVPGCRDALAAAPEMGGKTNGSSVTR